MPSSDKAKLAEKQRRYRERTGYDYDKKYKKAQERAFRRLAKQYPKAFKRIFNEERSEEGLPPVQER